MKPFTYKLHDSDVKSIATLMGCSPDVGLVNHLNELNRAHKLDGKMTIGAILEVVLEDLIAQHRNRRQPCEDPE